MPTSFILCDISINACLLPPVEAKLNSSHGSQENPGNKNARCHTVPLLIGRFMGPTRGPPGVDKTQVGFLLAAWTLLSGTVSQKFCLIWVRSRRCGCLVTWFCYQLIVKSGNKTATPSWPDQYCCVLSWFIHVISYNCSCSYQTLVQSSIGK